MHGQVAVVAYSAVSTKERWSFVSRKVLSSPGGEIDAGRIARMIVAAAAHGRATTGASPKVHTQQTGRAVGKGTTTEQLTNYLSSCHGRPRSGPSHGIPDGPFFQHNFAPEIAKAARNFETAVGFVSYV